LFSTIKKRAAEFKHGCTSLEDEPREGCPNSATTPEIIEQVHDMLLNDQRIKVRETAETIGISKERVGYILHEELDMKKLCARWVLRLLTADQKCTRMNISEQCLKRFITMHEIWIHHHTKIQTAVKTVNRRRLFSAKEDKVGSISRKGYGIGVLGC